ncbi:regulatory protein RecX [Aureispira sp. CCB-E]|uniref:regulatory protein RecX n=1 Tax=Aureispira sp. CCB-E TaxID=3051121 RepID=UPI00286936BD|nr:regulatory protein RecX [Aureispira sp. CCB-E]WMX15185.1 regulatory protein RecX [Aureispira sp. CCB-E]
MKKYISYDQARSKLQAFCAYQERCHKEVRSKLLDLGIYGDDVDAIIADLIEDNFLNELRYAIAFAGGKFRIKKWGKHRIIRELKLNQVSAYSIKKAIQSELPDEDYLETLEQVIQKRNRLLKEPNLYKRKQKIAKYVIDKGFESPLVWETIHRLYS